MKSPTKPYKHQTDAIKRAAAKPKNPSAEDAYAFLMETGTGKSKVVLDEWMDAFERGEILDHVIVAPAGCYRNWVYDKTDLELSEINKHCAPEFLDKLVVRVWKSGKRARKQAEEILATVDPKRPRLLVVNVEAFSRGGTGAEELVKAFLQQRPGKGQITVDESTTIKRDNAGRSESLQRLAGLARRRRIMTGLVTPKSPMDLFGQFWFLDWKILGFRNRFSYESRYFVLKKADFGHIYKTKVDKDGNPAIKFTKIRVGWRNEEELQQKVAKYAFRITKDQCLDLPPKIYLIRDVEITAEQDRIYGDLLENAFAEIEGKTCTANRAMTNALRRHQVLLGRFRADDGTIQELSSNRIKAMLEVLEEHSGKACIWVPYDQDMKNVSSALEEEYGKGSVARFWGGNRSTRPNDEKQFLGNNECRFMVATPAAAGRGNTWTNHSLVIFYANTNNLEHRIQAEDRAHRIGQRNSVTYVDLMVPGTIDMKIVEAMRKKLDMATLIMGDNYREWLV